MSSIFLPTMRTGLPCSSNAWHSANLSHERQWYRRLLRLTSNVSMHRLLGQPIIHVGIGFDVSHTTGRPSVISGAEFLPIVGTSPSLPMRFKFRRASGSAGHSSHLSYNVRK